MLNLNPDIYPPAKIHTILQQISLNIFVEASLILVLFTIRRFKPKMFSSTLVLTLFIELFLFARGNLITAPIDKLQVPTPPVNIDSSSRYLSTSDTLPYIGPSVYWNHLRVRQPFAPDLSNQELIRFNRLQQEISMYPANLNIFHRLHNASGYSAVVLNNYAQYWNSQLINSVAIPSLQDSRLDNLAVNYLITGYPDDFVADLPSFIQINSQPAIYQSQQPRPFAWFTSGKGSVQIISQTPEKIVLNTSSTQPDQLILSQSLYPGWRLSIDNRSSTIEAYQNTFQSTLLDPGHHTITFSYRPTSVKIGALISFTTLIILIFITQCPHQELPSLFSTGTVTKTHSNASRPLPSLRRSA